MPIPCSSSRNFNPSPRSLRCRKISCQLWRSTCTRALWRLTPTVAMIVRSWTPEPCLRSTTKLTRPPELKAKSHFREQEQWLVAESIREYSFAIGNAKERDRGSLCCGATWTSGQLRLRNEAGQNCGSSQCDNFGDAGQPKRDRERSFTQ